MNEMAFHSNEYWNGFYDKGQTLDRESQFASFVIDSLKDVKHVIDCGSGNGRDSFFFTSHGKNVVAMDASAVAISRCKQIASTCDGKAPHFQSVDFADINKLQGLATDLARLEGSKVIYARFFLHAVDEPTEENFLNFAKAICDQDTTVCLEFRTDLDSNIKKTTPLHYRRFIEPVAFLRRCFNAGFRPSYFVQGFGMAKQKTRTRTSPECLCKPRACYLDP